MSKKIVFRRQEPLLSPLSRERDPAGWGILNAHDPSLIEADGFFYAFSTGNNGQDLYQIRRSPDLVRWEYVGQAFPDPAALSPVLAQLRAVYGKPIENTTLWAPDIVPAAGGGYWLYGCFTAEFGNNYSVLFWRTPRRSAARTAFRSLSSCPAGIGAKRPTPSIRRSYMTSRAACS